jgi:hypothetical protein
MTQNSSHGSCSHPGCEWRGIQGCYSRCVVTYAPHCFYLTQRHAGTRMESTGRIQDPQHTQAVLAARLSRPMLLSRSSLWFKNFWQLDLRILALRCMLTCRASLTGLSRNVVYVISHAIKQESRNGQQAHPPSRAIIFPRPPAICAKCCTSDSAPPSMHPAFHRYRQSQDRGSVRGCTSVAAADA